MTASMHKPPVGTRGFQKHSHPDQPQSYAELVEQDSRPVPASIREFVTADVGDVGPFEVPTRWYTDRAVHDLEVEKIWKRTWQMACRVDHVREVGDTYLYEVAGLSFVIVRVTEELIKGYWNACLHRGVPIRRCAGRVERLQCPFHGFTWNLNGDSVLIPFPEEFPHLKPEKFALPEVQVATWQGFVFINPDLEAESLESYLGDFDGQFHRWPYTNREVTAHVTKIFPANWKSVQEAFMESFHVLTTHPQLALSSGADRCTAFGISGHYSLGVVPIGQTNDYVATTPEQQHIWRRLNQVWDDAEIAEDLKLPPGMTARTALANNNREMLRPVFGRLMDEASDTEMVDVFYWSLFPNFHPYGVFAGPMMYLYRPYGDNHDKCIMDVIFLSDVAEGAEPKSPPEVIMVGEDQDFTSVDMLGSFGVFVSQDTGNLNELTKGLRNSKRGTVNFARNYESKIRHFYAEYEQATGLSSAKEIAAMGR